MSKPPLAQRRKDRARPFSRKHARYWLTAVGGMVLIMAVNVGLGVWFMDDPPDALPPIEYAPIPPMVVPLDAGVPLDSAPGGGMVPPADVAPR